VSFHKSDGEQGSCCGYSNQEKHRADGEFAETHALPVPAGGATSQQPRQVGKRRTCGRVPMHAHA
jgi:hypothetical protein